MKKEKANITKKKMEAYEYVRKSGKTNMFDVRTVIYLSGGILTEEDCIDIMENYGKYIRKYFKEEK